VDVDVPKRTPIDGSNPPNFEPPKFEPPKFEPPRFEPPEVPTAVPEPSPVIITHPVTEVPAIVEAPVPVAIIEVPAAPQPVAVPAAPPEVVPQAATISLTSRIGTGTVALTLIIIVLISGVWFYANRLGSHLTNRRNNHA
jgi:hypothetical protein